MRRIVLAFELLIILGLINCKQNPTNQIDGQVSIDKEVFTLYSKANSIVHTARVLTTEDNSFDLIFYDVDISTPEGAKQKFISIESLTEQQLKSKRIDLQKTYNWTPIKGKDILFVQIQTTGFKNEMELLDMRQKIEIKLTFELENKKLGEWVASDLGPGGGNMLYTVTNINNALHTILQVLKQNNLDKNTLIGRRVLISNEDWFYEVIYPTQYSGDFNTM
jgi:hypothetical protein